MRRGKRLAALGLTAAVALNFAACNSGNGIQARNTDGGLYVGTAMQKGVPKDCMEKVFGLMTAEGSSYSKLKARNTGTKYTETREKDKITITASGTDVSGTWDFELKGNYIENISENDDYMASILFADLCEAAGAYMGLDADLFNGLLKAVAVTGLESEYAQVQRDETTGKTTYRLYVAGAYDFGGLDTVYLDQDTLAKFNMKAVGKDSVNYAVGAGKMNMFVSGNRDSLDIYMAEHGGCTELTYKSLVEAVKILHPAGYKEFLDNYTKLEETDTDGWQVSLLKDREQMPDFFWDLDEHQSCVKVHFGSRLSE